MLDGRDLRRGAPPFSYTVTIEHWVPAYGSGVPFGHEVIGEGAADPEAARHQSERLFATVGHPPWGWAEGVLWRVCGTCKITGIAPGCRKKPCPECRGRGTVEVERWRGFGRDA